MTTAAIPIYRQPDGTYRAPSIPFTDPSEIDSVDETQAEQFEVKVRKNGEPVEVRAWDVGLDGILYISLKQYDDLR